MDLVALVRFHTGMEFKEEKAELVKERQALYSESGKNREEYENVVRKI